GPGIHPQFSEARTDISLNLTQKALARDAGIVEKNLRAGGIIESPRVVDDLGAILVLVPAQEEPLGAHLECRTSAFVFFTHSVVLINENCMDNGPITIRPDYPTLLFGHTRKFVKGHVSRSDSIDSVGLRKALHLLLGIQKFCNVFLLGFR